MTQNHNSAPNNILLVIATTVAVLALHGIGGYELANMQSPPMEILEKTPPIDIELMSVTEEKPPEQVELEPVNNLQPEPMPLSEPTPEAPSEPTPPPSPKLSPKPSSKLSPKLSPKPTREPEPTPLSEPKETVVATDNFDTQHQQWVIKQQRLDREREQKLEAERLAKAKAERQAKAEAERLAKAEAERLAKAEAERLAKAASNTPQSFSASQASWRIRPVFTFPSRARGAGRSGDLFSGTLRVNVDKQGNVTSVSIARSSGNRVIDADAQRTMRQAKLNPFTKNGVPVVSVVVLPFRYDIP